jgi:hypothetical protein
MHKLMSVILSAVVIALCRAIRVVCLHDVSMTVIGVEGAHELSQIQCIVWNSFLRTHHSIGFSRMHRL